MDSDDGSEEDGDYEAKSVGSGSGSGSGSDDEDSEDGSDAGKGNGSDEDKDHQKNIKEKSKSTFKAVSKSSKPSAMPVAAKVSLLTLTFHPSSLIPLSIPSGVEWSRKWQKGRKRSVERRIRMPRKVHIV